MSQFATKTTVSAPIDQVWGIIGDFNGLTNYIDLIVESDMQGEGVGAIRTLTLADGAEIVEKLEALDPENKELKYSIVDGPFPFDNYISTMKLNDLGDTTEFEWYCSFDPNGASEQECCEIIDGVYQLGFAGVKRLCASG